MFIEDFEETREDFDEKMEGKLLRRNNSWKVLFRSDRALVSRIKRRRFFVMSCPERRNSIWSKKIK
jgi:hypothetical protein